MSAFLCSREHISALVNAVAFFDHDFDRIARHAFNGAPWEVTGENARDYVFDVLVEENLRSLESRYPDDYGPESRERVEAKRWKRARHQKLTVVEVIKLANSYEYQSCEHDGWKESAAKRYIESLVDELCSRLPGYDDARWSI